MYWAIHHERVRVSLKEKAILGRPQHSFFVAVNASLRKNNICICMCIVDNKSCRHGQKYRRYRRYRTSILLMTTTQASLLVEQRAVDVLFAVIKFNCPFMTLKMQAIMLFMLITTFKCYHDQIHVPWIFSFITEFQERSKTPFTVLKYLQWFQRYLSLRSAWNMPIRGLMTSVSQPNITSSI